MAEVYSVVDSLNLEDNADFWTDPSQWDAATIDAQLGNSHQINLRFLFNRNISNTSI